ncbi:MAG: LLM class flavin-dependent oxidoreductase, partial [Actinomycetota bacterium]
MSGPVAGVVLQGAYPPAEFSSMVERIDALGFSHLWLTDSSLHARNSYAYLTLAATRSPRLLLGTAVTNPLTRHPAVTAVAAATVDELSGGRMILGIGAGDRPLLALGMRPARLSSLRAAIGAIRALWSGAEVSVDDPAFTLDGAHLRFDARGDIPIYISASGPKTLELAGEVADGVILLVGLFPEALTWALEHVDRGAAKAGRPRPHVAVFAYGA